MKYATRFPRCRETLIRTNNGAAYMIVVGLSWLSFLLLPPVAFGYEVLVSRAWRRKREGIGD